MALNLKRKETRMTIPSKEPEKSVWAQMGNYAQLGFLFPAATVVGWLLGTPPTGPPLRRTDPHSDEEQLMSRSHEDRVPDALRPRRNLSDLCG